MKFGMTTDSPLTDGPDSNVPPHSEESGAKIKGRKRLFFFYNRPVQIRYAMTALMIIAGTIAVYSFILFSQVQQVLGVRQVNPMMDVEQLSAEAMQKFIMAIGLGSLVCVAIIGTAAAVWAMLLSHRYEGPIARINLHLRDIIEGRATGPLKIRKRDEVHELVENLNVVLTGLREKKDATNGIPKSH